MSRSHASPHQFTEKIDRAVRAAFVAGAKTLPELVGNLPGIYPTVVTESAARLNLRLLERPSGRALVVGSKPPRFPLPHPLDFDWRFTSGTLARLVATARPFLERPGQLFCFGCPSLAMYAKTKMKSDRVRLLDINNPLHEGAEVWHSSARTPMKLGRGVVVLDPPWYPGHFREFLWHVRAACSLGTHVFMAAPSWGTRPSCGIEMRRLRAWCGRHGFAVLSIAPSALRYVTPLFEHNTLEAQGLRNIPLDWRTADLWHLKLVSRPAVGAPRKTTASSQWVERKSGDVRIRIRTGSPVIAGPASLVPLGTNGFLPTVSVREALRGHANVVTSGGRFLKCTDPQAFIDVFNQEPSFPNSAASKPLRLAVARIIKREQDESLRYYEAVSQIARS